MKKIIFVFFCIVLNACAPVIGTQESMNQMEIRMRNASHTNSRIVMDGISSIDCPPGYVAVKPKKPNLGKDVAASYQEDGSSGGLGGGDNNKNSSAMDRTYGRLNFTCIEAGDGQ